jgi:hypothetical protein
MRFGALHAVLPLTLLISVAVADDPPRFIRSLSGPSGTVSGSNFIFDSTRSRFVYPQDKSLTIFFEWEALPGSHVLTGIWKQPDGRIGTISPDVKINTLTKTLTCYWIFNLVPGLQNGFWALDVRVDGQPSGSHPFEIAGMEEPKTDAAAPPPAPKLPTLDEIFKAVNPSLVWVHRLDNTGRRIDTASGFVIGQDRIATAFQAVDASSRLEIEFGDGRKVVMSALRAWSRNADWAILDAATGSASALPRGDPKSVGVGDRLIVFNVESGARVMGGVDIGARRMVAGFGERIQISPALAAEAAGGPLLDLAGHVVGILGGSLYPGARSPRQSTDRSLAVWNVFNILNAATPVTELPENFPAETRTLEALTGEGMMTSPVQPMAEILYGGTSNQMPKNATGSSPRDVSDFSARDAQVWIYAMLAKKSKLSRGEISVAIFDSANRIRVTSPGKKVTLGEPPERFSVSFSPANLQPGVYRVDLNWDGHPAWRTFIRVTE